MRNIVPQTAQVTVTELAYLIFIGPALSSLLGGNTRIVQAHTSLDKAFA